MIEEDKNENLTKSHKTQTILTLFLYCIAGSLLTIVNKLAIVAFPFTNMLLVLQNGITVILLLINFYFSAFSSESVPPLNIAILKMWIPIVLLFVMMLTSSLFALTYVSVPTVIVIRNLSTLSVAVFEYLILGNKIDNLSIGTLIGMLFGAIVYAIHDLTFSIQGYIWLFVNIIGTSLYQVYIKKIVDMPLMKNIGPISMSFYNNLISLPILIILICITGEFQSLSLYFQSIFLPKIKPICVVFLSCILGFLLSTSAFALNRLISPTSIMVANNVNKFSVIILSEILVQSTLDSIASVGAISVLVFGWLYSQTKERFSKIIFLVVSIIFVILYIGLKVKHVVIPIVNTAMFMSFNSTKQINNKFTGNSTGVFNGKTKKLHN